MHSQTTPAKSNLTRSGSLLNKTKVRKITDGWEISPDKEDQEKANNLEKIGYKYLVLTKNELRKLDKFFKDLIINTFK